MPRRALAPALLLLLLGAPAPSGAEDAPAAGEGADFARPGLYAIAAGSLGLLLEDSVEQDFGFYVGVDPELGFNLRGGYRVIPRLGMEVEIEWFDHELDAPGGNIDVEAFTLSYNVKPYLLTGRVQPYLLLGVGLMRGKISDHSGNELSQRHTDFASQWGGGVDAYLTENVALNLGLTYVLPSGKLGHFDTLSLGWGVMYRF
jgi:opacity protein-like surface antigen